MKTIIKTNIKDSRNVQVKETVLEVFEALCLKGSFILLKRIDHAKNETNVIISKSSIKMVKEQ